jgi:hypothetical protein
LTLRGLASIHPDLIFYYIKSLNLKFAEADSSRYLEFFQGIRELKREYFLQRNRWAIRQIDQLATYKLALEVIQSAQGHFQKLISETRGRTPTPEPKLEVDSNELDYFVVKYYQRDRKIDYDPGINYHDRRGALEDSLRKRFESTLLNLSSLRRVSHGNLIKDFLRYWYLYDSESAEAQGNGFASRFVLGVVEHYYLLDDQPNDLIKRPRLSVGGGVYYNRAYRLAETIPIVELGREFHIERPTQLPQRLFSIQYQVKLRRYLSVLSYLNFEIGMLTSRGEQQFLFFDDLPRSWSIKDENEVVIARYTEALRFRNGRMNISSMESYFAKLSVPVVVVTRGIMSELGLQIGKNRVSYTLEYNYSYRLTEERLRPRRRTTVLKEGESGDIRHDRTATQWVFSPTLDLVFYLPYRLSLTVSIFEKFSSMVVRFAIL